MEGDKATDRMREKEEITVNLPVLSGEGNDT